MNTQVQLCDSRWLSRWLFGVHSLAALAIGSADLPPGVGAGLLIGVAGSLALHWVRTRSYVKTLHRYAQGNWLIEFSTGQREVARLVSAVANRWLVVLRFESGAWGTRSLLVCRDAARPGQWQSLQWLLRI